MIRILGYCPLLLESDNGPLPFWNERPREKVHVHAKVVQATKKHVCGNCPFFKYTEEFFGSRFNYDVRKYWLECLFLIEGLSPNLIRTVLRRDQSRKRIIPSSDVYPLVCPAR
jgi:hypothetical protein